MISEMTTTPHEILMASLLNEQVLEILKVDDEQQMLLLKGLLRTMFFEGITHERENS